MHPKIGMGIVEYLPHCTLTLQRFSTLSMPKSS